MIPSYYLNEFSGENNVTYYPINAESDKDSQSANVEIAGDSMHD